MYKKNLSQVQCWIYKSSDQVYICMKVKASDNFGNFWMAKKKMETILFWAHKLNTVGS